MVSCEHLSPVQKGRQIACLQLSSGFLDLYTLQVTRTHSIRSNIMAHLDELILLSDKQYAFRKWHSFENQLTTVIDDLAKILDNQGQVDTYMYMILYWILKKHLTLPLMNFLRANCLAMELGKKQTMKPVKCNMMRLTKKRNKIQALYTLGVHLLKILKASNASVSQLLLLFVDTLVCPQL